MFYILSEDLAKLYPKVGQAIKALSDGVQRIEIPVTVGEDLPAFHITGYWIVDGIRLDIRIEKG